MLRPYVIHSCFDQNKILAYVEPLLSSPLTKNEFTEIWTQAAKALGQVRPKNCRCRYRVSAREGEILVEYGVASYLVTEWRYNEEKKMFFPAPNPNLVWGGQQAENLGLVRSSLAAKTPRVQTIEKAHMERAFIDGKKEDLDRIEEWGELSRGVIAALTKGYWPEPFDPFKGLPVVTRWENQRTKYANKRH
jgi:hypothetical protein